MRKVILAILIILIIGSGFILSPQTSAQEAVSTVSGVPATSRTFLQLLEAVSGRKAGEESTALLQGVAAIARDVNGFAIKRDDHCVVKLGSDTKIGARWLECWGKVEKTAGESCGPAGSEFVKSIRAVSRQGDRVAIVRQGAGEVSIDVRKMVPATLHLPVHVESVSLSNISLILDASGEHPAARDIKGIHANFSWLGIGFSLNLKEFARWVESNGNRHIYFAIANPTPAPLRTLLHISPLIPFSFTMRPAP